MAENDETNNGTDGGALRKQLEEALKGQKEMQAKLAAFEAKERQASVGDVLAKRGYKPSVAKFVPEDVGSDEAKLDAWLKENLDVFAPVGDGAEVSESGEVSAPEGAAEAFNRIEKVGSAGKNSVPNLDSIQAAMKACNTPAELDSLLAQYKMS